MDEKLLRELIKLVAQTGLLSVAGRALSSSSNQTEPTGLKAFLPWLRPKSAVSSQSPEQKKETAQPAALNSREWAEQHTAEIMRSVLGDSAQAGSAGESTEDALKSAISGSINQQAPRPGSETDTNSVANLKAVIAGSVKQQDAVASGNEPPEQPTVPGIEQTPAPSKKEPSRTSTAMDAVQLVLDVIGAFDPTPITDGANSLISVGRAVLTDPERRKEHLQNAAISAVSMIPYIGDTSKLAKVPRAAKTMGRTARMARGTDTVKAMSSAEKRTARESLRDSTDQLLSRAGGGGDASTEGENPSAFSSPNSGNGNSQPPGTPPPVMSPSPDDPGNSGPKAKSDEAEGVDKYYEWREALKDSGKKLLDFGGIIGKGVLKVAAFVQGLNWLNTGVLALNRELAAYNGQIATAYAKSDAADIRRDMRKANAMSGPLSGLADEQSELKDTIASLTVPLQTIATGVLEKTTALVNWTVRITGIIEPGVAALEWLASWFGKQGAGEDTAWKTFFQDVSDGKFDGKRPSFVDPKAQILNDNDHREVFGK